jgi:hypothetical protein
MLFLPSILCFVMCCNNREAPSCLRRTIFAIGYLNPCNSGRGRCGTAGGVFFISCCCCFWPMILVLGFGLSAVMIGVFYPFFILLVLAKMMVVAKRRYVRSKY